MIYLMNRWTKIVGYLSIKVHQSIILIKVQTTFSVIALSEA
jgi:hypothetical protein